LQNFAPRAQIFARQRVVLLGPCPDHAPMMKMGFALGALLSLCSAVAGAGGDARPETFVIHGGPDGGRTATIKVPVGSIATFSANGAETLDNGDSRVEAMRLHGNVRIDIIGTIQSGVSQPIHIQADNVVLELTADETPHWLNLFRPVRSLRSNEVIGDADATQIFVGNVSFKVPTSAGPMQITADRIEHSSGTVTGT
jgi:hypothetical protein